MKPALILEQLALCGGQWWSVVVVRSCMWRWRYIDMKPALTLEQLALCGGCLQR